MDGLACFRRSWVFPGTMALASSIVMSLAFLAPASGQSPSLDTALDGLGKIDFGITSPLTIGDTVDVLAPDVPKQRCITFADGDIKPDTEGAVSSLLTWNFVRDTSSFEDTFKVSYSLEASSSANFASILSGGTTLNNKGSFESFLKNESDTALLVIEAFAEHGREMIQKFGLDDSASKLIDKGDLAGFRNRCGTHFIRGWTKRSSIRVVFQISNVGRYAKLALENTMDTSASGKVGIDDLSAEAKTKISTTISNTLNLASKIGKISATVEAQGGKGIATISQLLSAGDPASPDFVSKLLSSLAEASKDFTQKNAAPDKFILVTHPFVDKAKVAFNSANYEKLGKIYKILLRVDQRLSTYSSYKSKDFKTWDRYFRVKTAEIENLRADIVKGYTSCKDAGQCDIKLPSTIDGLLLDDFFSEGTLTARCIYSNHYDDTISGQTVESFDYLSSIALFWKSKVNFLQAVDLDSTEATGIDSDLKIQKLPFDPSSRMRIKKDPNADSGDIYIDVARTTVDPRSVVKDGSISIDAIRDIRRRTAQSIFIINVQMNNGLPLEEVLGRPDMTNCPAYKPTRS